VCVCVKYHNPQGGCFNNRSSILIQSCKPTQLAADPREILYGQHILQ